MLPPVQQESPKPADSERVGLSATRQGALNVAPRRRYPNRIAALVLTIVGEVIAVHQQINEALHQPLAVIRDFHPNNQWFIRHHFFDM